MRVSLAGRTLLGFGAAIGVAASIAWFLGYDPSTLPPALLKLAAYKLTAIAAVGLMAAGAVALRFGRRVEMEALQQEQPAVISGDRSSTQIGTISEHSAKVRVPAPEQRP